MRFLCYGILLQFCFILIVECQFKKWLKNTDLSNPYNWDSGRVPCGNDKVVLPDDSPVVFLQMNTTIQELVLPKKVELVFGSYATLAFTNDPDHSAACLDSGVSDYVTFNATHPEDWIDPYNWCPTDTDQGPCKDKSLLHAEMIPCSTDNVVFPTGSSYYVNLGSNLEIEINTLKVSGKAYSGATFRDYLQTDNGRKVFPPPAWGLQSSITINRRRCTDMTGCACGNDRERTLQAMCKIQQPRCKRPKCATTVHPVGHCCGICGGLMNITFGVGFNLNTLKNGLQRNYLEGKEQFKDVQYMVSKRTDGKIQIVLKDEDGGQSSKVARQMFSALIDDVKNGGVKYSVTGVTISTSNAGSSENSGGSTSEHTGKQSTGSRGKVAAIVIGVIVGICAITVVVLFVYRRKIAQEGESSGFRIFNRFNIGPERRPQIQFPPSVAFSWGSWGSRDSGLSSVSGGASQGFDNPMYGSKSHEDVPQMELQMTVGDFSGMSEGQPIDDRGFENPLYDNVQQESLFEDPTAAEKDNIVTIRAATLEDSQTSA